MPDQESAQSFIRITYYQGLLIASGFTILGVLLGAWLNHRFAGNRDKTNRRIEAGVALIETFRITILSLDKPSDAQIDPQYTINHNFGQQEKAAGHFRLTLSGRKLKGFDKAWAKYKENQSKQKYEGITSEREQKRQAALEDIHKILKFTGYKK